MFGRLFEKKAQKFDFAKYVFIDIEYISDDQHIAEIAIASIANGTPEIQIYERVNPFDEVDFKINKVAQNVSRIPLESLMASRKFSDLAHQVRSIIGGKTIVHWGGNDPAILKKAFNRAGLEVGLGNTFDLMAESGESLFMKFTAAFPSVSAILNIESPLHCARIDSIMLASLFGKSRDQGFSLDVNKSNLFKYVEHKKCDLELFATERRIKPVSHEGALSKHKLKVYFTGFEEEKSVLAKKYADLGISVVSSAAVKSINYLIIPHASYTSENVERFRQRNPKGLLTLEEFRLKIKRLSEELAS